ncbi:endothelin-3b [Archocentrus centrarchus]|uniref:endothelin-3b n=1 Tax=Archocentrus centrarchus TaxID=63155 RepID=UPI0011EA27CF|nr:endothelin-3-like [Archocentrus centrarchus]
MAKMLSIIIRIMLFKILTIILLQATSNKCILASHALVKPEMISGGFSDSKVFGSRGSAGSQLSETTEAKSRQKRCTCYSYKDKECVYYCHLDIIWINTPERTVPYGMSSYRGPQRKRRAVQPPQHGGAKTPRCACVVSDADLECRDFCLSSSLEIVPTRSLHRIPGLG